MKTTYVLKQFNFIFYYRNNLYISAITINIYSITATIVAFQ